ncbi:hypothetical protein D3C83_43570 [compost metagenome]
MPVVARVLDADRLAVFDDVGEDVDFRMLGPHVFAQDVDFQRAEAAAEFDVPGVADALVAEEDDRALVEGLLDAREGLVVEILRKIDLLDFGAEKRAQGFCAHGE